jgi:hypothetical protein
MLADRIITRSQPHAAPSKTPDHSLVRDAHDSLPHRASSSHAALVEPRRSNPPRDAHRAVRVLHDPPPAPVAHRIVAHRTGEEHHAPVVPIEVKRAVQAAGGIVRGIATPGSGPAQAFARGFRFRGIPGAAIINGAFAVHDTIREFQRSGLSQDTVRTAARGAGGVLGAFKGGALGATYGAAVGGPVGAVIGGAAGALIGGFAGSKFGEGAVDAIYGAAGVVRHAAGKVADVASDVADTVGDAAHDVADAAGDVASGIAHGVGDAADAVGGAIDSITPW